MDLQLKGRKAVVTGGSRGIGRAIVELLADEGADVALCARGADQLATAVDGLKCKGVNAWGRAVDVADGDALKAFVNEAGETLGGIDILVSNVSALPLTNDEAAWQATFDIDVMGAVRSFEAAAPFLIRAGAENGDAAFLITSSFMAAEATNVSPYGAMKAALIHYAKGVARDYAAQRVRCNTISPGTVLHEGAILEKLPAEIFDAWLARNPTGRMATAEEIAAAAVFLVSPRSAFTTGINMSVDGAISPRVNF